MDLPENSDFFSIAQDSSVKMLPYQKFCGKTAMECRQTWQSDNKRAFHIDRGLEIGEKFVHGNVLGFDKFTAGGRLDILISSFSYNFKNYTCLD